MKSYSIETIKTSFQKIIDKIDEFKQINSIQRDITIVAVSKTHPIEAIINGIKAGIEHFGENYAQEMRQKFIELEKLSIPCPKWHFIGHLQTNKVKYIAPFVYMIHSVDSEELAREIQKQAEKNSREIDVLLQVNVSGERSKFGCNPNETISLIEKIKNYENIRVRGLMTIGSFSTEENIIRSEFRLLRQIFEQSKELYPELPLTHLSMGMSHDYLIAIEEGATIVRIGTAIFGERHYH
ncbi:MAG: YggS family pyridoxal phosphate-dependent enzyme [Candidatus Kapaibacteriales bacterium]